jgi:hypothetical protein
MTNLVLVVVLVVTARVKLPNNLLRAGGADDIRLVRTTCCESVGLINLVTR